MPCTENPFNRCLLINGERIILRTSSELHKAKPTFICKKWITEIRYFLFSFYFKQGLSQMWEGSLKYYEIHLKLQYKVLIKYHLVK